MSLQHRKVHVTVLAFSYIGTAFLTTKKRVENLVTRDEIFDNQDMIQATRGH